MRLAEVLVDVLDTRALIEPDQAALGHRVVPIGLVTSAAGDRLLVTADCGFRTLLCSPETELVVGLAESRGRPNESIAVARSTLERLPIVARTPLLEFVAIPRPDPGPLSFGPSLPDLARALGVDDAPAPRRLR